MKERTEKVNLKTDSDGFLSQECPSCLKIFKVVFEEGSEAGKVLSFCPYCRHEGQNCWWTQAQAKFFGDFALNTFVGPKLDELEQRFKKGSGGFLDISVTSNRNRSPVAPAEPADEMSQLEFTCCNETIKHDESSNALYCILCGLESEGDSKVNESALGS